MHCDYTDFASISSCCTLTTQCDSAREGGNDSPIYSSHFQLLPTRAPCYTVYKNK
jgi:hypothetical protein